MLNKYYTVDNSNKSDHVFNILNICVTLFTMLHHCMTCNVSQYLQKNAAYIKPLKKESQNNELWQTDPNPHQWSLKKLKSSAHHISRMSMICKVYISGKIYT